MTGTRERPRPNHVRHAGRPIAVTLFAFVVFGLALSGCLLDRSDLNPTDGGTDASTPFDGGTDASPPIDAGRDSGPVDSGPPVDAGMDSGPPDAGPPDAGPPDAGPPDAGPPDTGPPCVPSSPEETTCDARDDDCDGEVDEDDVCRCPTDIRDGRVYLFCTSVLRRWTSARDFCSNRSYELVKVDDSAENDYLRMHPELSGASSYWVGLSDTADEGTYRWLDDSIAWQAGAAVGYTEWAGGAPDESDPPADCVYAEQSSGEWQTDRCGEFHFTVCESPL